ncbi:MAG: sulfatase-like hydrolase/transferase, partial [Lachnospiraceae bacterium]|nr:sulfatase-like hydrolase/transferase [Lachnospiraceae bacterium]
NQFELSSGENVIVFMPDTLDAEWLEEYLEEVPEAREKLRGFTYFDNAVAGGAPTLLGVPAILTGEIYDRTETVHMFYKESYGNATLFEDFKNKGYDVNIYSEIKYLDGADGFQIDNAETGIEYEISDKWAFTKRLYRLACVYAVPQDLKELFWFYGDDLSSMLTMKDAEGDVYTLDDPLFYEQMNEKGITLNDSKGTFVFYHLLGAHGPYTMDAESKRVGEGNTDRKEQIKGTFNIIFTYIDMLKELGIYDDCTIIITGDHGGVKLYQNPAILIKRPGDNGEFRVDSSPVTFKNLHATLEELAGGETEEPGLFDVPEDQDIIRYHAVDSDVAQNVFPEDEDVMSSDYSLIAVHGNARDLKDIYVEHNLDPVNTIELKLSEEIDFTKDDGKTYPALGSAEPTGRWVIGNSVQFELVLTDYESGDVTVRVDTGRTLNPPQRVGVYLNGEKTGDFVCNEEEGSLMFTVKEDQIKDGTIAFKLELPDAVRPSDLDSSSTDKRKLSVTIKDIVVK